MINTEINLSGVAHVKVDFISLQKMHVIPNVRKVFLRYKF